jgi:hypothetical protein
MTNKDTISDCATAHYISTVKYATRKERIWILHWCIYLFTIYEVHNGYWGFLPMGLSGRDVKLTTHFHLAPRLKCVEPYFHSPIRLRGVVLI